MAHVDNLLTSLNFKEISVLIVYISPKKLKTKLLHEVVRSLSQRSRRIEFDVLDCKDGKAGILSATQQYVSIIAKVPFRSVVFDYLQNCYLPGFALTS